MPLIRDEFPAEQGRQLSKRTSHIAEHTHRTGLEVDDDLCESGCDVTQCNLDNGRHSEDQRVKHADRDPCPRSELDGDQHEHRNGPPQERLRSLCDASRERQIITVCQFFSNRLGGMTIRHVTHSLQG